MKKALLAALLMVAATAAWGATPGEIRAGAVEEGTSVELSGVVVTSVLHSSFTVTALPAGPDQALWVMTDPDPMVAVGDVLDLRGVYIEYKDITTIWAHGWTVVDQIDPPTMYATAAQLMGEPERYESCVLQVTDGLIVVEILPEGDWIVVSFEDGTTLVRLNAYWFDPSIVFAGQCYNNATGLFTYHEGEFLLKVFPDGLALTDCTVDNDDVSFGSIKALYR